MPRSAIIWTRSRELSLKARYHLTHRMMISWSKCPPLEQILCRGRFRHPGRYGCAPVFSSLHQNQRGMVRHYMLSSEDLALINRRRGGFDPERIQQGSAKDLGE